MANTVRNFLRFATDSVRIVLKGNRLYWLWVISLLVVIGLGAAAYYDQAHKGLITTNMRDQVSWAFYIGNFTFLVGVAAAAVLLVIPAYVYEWKPIKEVVILGELLAISSIVMMMATTFFMAASTPRSKYAATALSWKRSRRGSWNVTACARRLAECKVKGCSKKSSRSSFPSRPMRRHALKT